jgi:hypothetical protein
MEHYENKIKSHKDYNKMIEAAQRKGIDTNDMQAVTDAYL